MSRSSTAVPWDTGVGSARAGTASAWLGGSAIEYPENGLPVASDLPMIDSVVIEVPNDKHPQGVRGVAEVPIVPAMAAVANAIRNAIGLRLTDLPMSPPKVLAALTAAK